MYPRNRLLAGMSRRLGHIGGITESNVASSSSLFFVHCTLPLKIGITLARAHPQEIGLFGRHRLSRASRTSPSLSYHRRLACVPESRQGRR
jgi:hypothetical protein